ncbi:unnamed protein product [Brachionus calyciflorus]|uniref:Uncharacterized protein n=1 Tax=Brachionus calyciflorus TaxID=104777 RepID=A0A814HRZ5_9BILA|nr:unnamed protein product [Brachionus calyciflorus]
MQQTSKPSNLISTFDKKNFDNRDLEKFVAEFNEKMTKNIDSKKRFDHLSYKELGAKPKAKEQERSKEEEEFEIDEEDEEIIEDN